MTLAVMSGPIYPSCSVSMGKYWPGLSELTAHIQGGACWGTKGSQHTPKDTARQKPQGTTRAGRSRGEGGGPTGKGGGPGCDHQGPQRSASIHFSSSLSFLTNSWASLLERPSSIRSADLTVGRYEGGHEKGSMGQAHLPQPHRVSLTLSSGPAQV